MMSKIVFTFALSVIIFGSVLMNDFCKKFVQNYDNKNVIIFRVKEVEGNQFKTCVSIGSEYWILRFKDSGDYNEMSLSFVDQNHKSKNNSNFFSAFDENLMIFPINLGDIRGDNMYKDVKYVVIDKERNQLVWSEWDVKKSDPDYYKESKKIAITWIKGTPTLAMNDLSIEKKYTNKVILLEKNDTNKNSRTLNPSVYSLNKTMFGSIKSLKEGKNEWINRLSQLKSSYDIIGVFFYHNQYNKDHSEFGLTFFFRDHKTIKWCWAHTDEEIRQRCNNATKVLVDCKDTPDMTTTASPSTPTPDSDDFPIVWILVAIAILVVVIVVILVFIFCFLLTSNEDNDNTTVNPSSVSTIQTNRSSAKPKTFSNVFAAKGSTNTKTVSKSSKA